MTEIIKYPQRSILGMLGAGNQARRAAPDCLARTRGALLRRSRFKINPAFLKRRFFRGLICFFLLAALAMTLLNPIVTTVLFAIILAASAAVTGRVEYETGYIAVALTVSKNE